MTFPGIWCIVVLLGYGGSFPCADTGSFPDRVPKEGRKEGRSTIRPPPPKGGKAELRFVRVLLFPFKDNFRRWKKMHRTRLTFVVPPDPPGINDLHVKLSHQIRDFVILEDAGKDLTAGHAESEADFVAKSKGNTTPWAPGDKLRFEFITDGEPEVREQYWTKDGQRV